MGRREVSRDDQAGRAHDAGVVKMWQRLYILNMFLPSLSAGPVVPVPSNVEMEQEEKEGKRKKA